MYLDRYTGRGIHIAVVDSGVHADHPHIVGATGPDAPRGGGVIGGVGIHEDGSLDDDYVDRMGHGTAVTAAIREKAPDAQIIVVKIFWRALASGIATLVRGLEEACERGAHIISLSLGTGQTAHRDVLERVVVRAASHGILMVSALEDDGVRWLPGSLDGVVPVLLDWKCPRDAYRIVGRVGRTAIAASGYPRDIAGVPPDRNLKGISFAVANATGFVARALEATPHASLADLFETMKADG